MRDNTKGGALTEVTFYILLSLYTPRNGSNLAEIVMEEKKNTVLRCMGRKSQKKNSQD